MDAERLGSCFFAEGDSLHDHGDDIPELLAWAERVAAAPWPAGPVLRRSPHTVARDVPGMEAVMNRHRFTQAERLAKDNAEALLFAAAPDLLLACKEAAIVLAELAKATHADPMQGTCLPRLMAAIKKAQP